MPISIDKSGRTDVDVYNAAHIDRRVFSKIRSSKDYQPKKETAMAFCIGLQLATVYKGNIIKNLIMDCQSYTKYRPNETTGGIFVSWRRKEELPTGA